MSASDIQQKRHLSTDCPRASLREFQEIEFILLQKGNNLHNRSLAMFEEAGFNPKVKMTLSQLVTAYRFAEQGLGATFISDRIIFTAPSGELLYFSIASQHANRLFYMLLPKEIILLTQLMHLLNSCKSGYWRKKVRISHESQSNTYFRDFYRNRCGKDSELYRGARKCENDPIPRNCLRTHFFRNCRAMWRGHADYQSKRSPSHVCPVHADRYRLGRKNVSYLCRKQRLVHGWSPDPSPFRTVPMFLTDSPGLTSLLHCNQFVGEGTRDENGLCIKFYLLDTPQLS